MCLKMRHPEWTLLPLAAFWAYVIASECAEVSSYVLKVFGVPSIRRDIAPPDRPSVANTVSYGDGATMQEMMQPRQACLAADQFQKLQSKENIR